MVASQRKYICSFCAKAFSRSEHRARHERSHTGVKPFTCTVCSHSFVRRDLLQRHIRTVHRNLLCRGCGEQSQGREVSSGECSASPADNAHVRESVGSETRNSAHVRGADAATATPASFPVEGDYLQDQIVNSMIEVNLEGNSERRSKASSPDHAISFLPEPSQISGVTTEVGLEVDLEQEFTLPESMQLLLIEGIISKGVDRLLAPRLLVWFNHGMKCVLREKLFAKGVISTFRSSCKSSKGYQLLSDNSPLPLAVVCLGSLFSGENVDLKNSAHLWQCCWNYSMKKPFHQSFAALNLLVHIYVRVPHVSTQNPLNISTFYQQVLYTMVQCAAHRSWFSSKDDVWLVFDMFGDLIVLSNEYSEVSMILYRWFLQQPLFNGQPLSHMLSSACKTTLVNTPKEVVRTIIKGLFCETVMKKSFHVQFQSDESLHNALIMTNKIFSESSLASNDEHASAHFKYWKMEGILNKPPQRFFNLLLQYAIPPQGLDHWGLWFTTWLEFVSGCFPGQRSEKFSINSHWLFGYIFADAKSDSPLDCIKNLEMNCSFINNSVAICSLPLIGIFESKQWPPREYIPENAALYAIDVLLFHVKLFGTLLFLPHLLNEKVDNGSVKQAEGLLENPIVQLLIFTWYRTIYQGNDNAMFIVSKSFAGTYDLENRSVESFIRNFISLTEKTLDSDLIIKKGLGDILFGGDEHLEDFFGFHYLLYRIIIHVCGYMQNLLTVSQLKTETKDILLGLQRDLKCLKSDIKSKIDLKQPSKDVMHSPKIMSGFPNTVLQQPSPLELPAEMVYPSRSVDFASFEPEDETYVASSPTSKCTEQRIILPPIKSLDNQKLNIATSRIDISFFENTNYRTGHSPFQPFYTYQTTSHNRTSNALLHSGKIIKPLHFTGAKIKLPLPFNIFETS